MQILIRAPESLKSFLQHFAKSMGMPVNSLILQILWAWVNKQTKEGEIRS